MLKLSLWYIDATPEQITAACTKALVELEQRGVTIDTAISAVVAAGELPESFTEDATPNADAVSAWYAAESAAFTCIQNLTGRWPDQASLIAVEG